MEDIQAIFTGIIRNGIWLKLDPANPETVCGPGSARKACAPLVGRLGEWFRTYGIKTVVDLGSGDFHWMRSADLSETEYDGYDIVPELVSTAAAAYGRPNIRFHHADVTTLKIPAADLVICKDVLNHFPKMLAAQVLDTIRASGSRHFAAMTFPGPTNNNGNIRPGQWKFWDLEIPPFGLGPPADFAMSDEQPPRRFALWKFA